MDALRALMDTVPGWLAGSLVPLLALLAGCLAGWALHARAARKRIRSLRTGWRSRLRDSEMQVQALEDANSSLEESLQAREIDLAGMAARMAEAASRDRDELVRLQEELESELRIGQEKARLIRSAEAAQALAQAALRQARIQRERQRASLSALQAALSHAKRAQARTEDLLGRLREQLRQRAAPPQTPAAAPERVVERIVEIPVETIVYRDREVPVEVPIEVPVGFTPFAAPAAGKGFAARYSENRPNST